MLQWVALIDLKVLPILKEIPLTLHETLTYYYKNVQTWCNWQNM